MSTSYRRALLHVPISFATAALLALAVVLFSPAPNADAVSRSAGENIVDIAASKRGTPYAYGATGPGAFDCSGFTSWVFDRAGKHLPRTSDAQAAYADRIPASQGRPGDLVFFHSGGNVYHVGIYAGNGRIWHAPKPGSAVHLAPIWTPAHFFGRVN